MNLLDFFSQSRIQKICLNACLSQCETAIYHNKFPLFALMSLSLKWNFLKSSRISPIAFNLISRYLNWICANFKHTSTAIQSTFTGKLSAKFEICLHIRLEHLSKEFSLSIIYLCRLPNIAHLNGFVCVLLEKCQANEILETLQLWASILLYA